MASFENSTLVYISYLNTFSFHSCTYHFITCITLKSFTCHVFSRYFSACHSASCIHTSRYAVSNTVLYILRILTILLYFAAQVSCNRNLRCIWRGPAPSRWAVTWFLSHFYLSAFWQQHPPLRGTPWSQGSSAISPVRCIVFKHFSSYWGGSPESICQR